MSEQKTLPFNEDEQRQALRELITRPPIPVEIDPPVAMILIGQLQLAIRHPQNTGTSAAYAREFIEALRSRICEPGSVLDALITAGFDPDYDVPADEKNITYTGLPQTTSGRTVYPAPMENPNCQCNNALAAFYCRTGHMLECHYPMTCSEANCSHMDNYGEADGANAESETGARN